MLLAVGVVFAILGLAELGWHKGWMESELGRKAVHMSVGSFVALWPFFLSWWQVQLLSAAFLVVVIFSKSFNVFRVIHSVQRPTYGEICFALIVGILPFITQDRAIYAAAILLMGLADGLAAVVGTKYGRTTRYHVLGHTKSIVGTLTFFVVSLAILIGYAAFSPAAFSPAAFSPAAFSPWLVFIAALVALIENIAVLGLDNLFVPLVAALALVWLKAVG